MENQSGWQPVEVETDPPPLWRAQVVQVLPDDFGAWLAVFASLPAPPRPAPPAGAGPAPLGPAECAAALEGFRTLDEDGAGPEDGAQLDTAPAAQRLELWSPEDQSRFWDVRRAFWLAVPAARLRGACAVRGLAGGGTVYAGLGRTVALYHRPSSLYQVH
jgi:hypothetical protein